MRSLGLLCLGQHLLTRNGVFTTPSVPVDATLFERLHITQDKAQDALDKFLDSRDEVAAMANMMGR